MVNIHICAENIRRGVLYTCQVPCAVCTYKMKESDIVVSLNWSAVANVLYPKIIQIDENF